MPFRNKILTISNKLLHIVTRCHNNTSLFSENCDPLLMFTLVKQIFRQWRCAKI